MPNASFWLRLISGLHLALVISIGLGLRVAALTLGIREATSGLRK